MANMEERLEAVVASAETDGSKWHTIVHGDENSTIETENGDVPTVAKQLKDIREAITGGVSDVVAEAESARDEAIAARNATNQLKNDTNIIKSDTEQLKTDTLNIKNQANQIFNNISSATDTAVSTIQTESSAQISAIQNSGVTQINSVNSAGNTQIADVQAEGQKQIERAEAQANQAKYYAESTAPAPLGSRLSVPANKKVPDGYEPVWFKNTITRARYPDFFTQLVDTDYLVFVDEDTYDNQVSNYGMCASYVKVDNDTVILPLLANYARSGTLDNIGNVLNDQFQGHWHEMVYRQDSTSSGYRADIFGNDGYTGNPSATNGTDEYMQLRGSRTSDWLCAVTPITDSSNGNPRFGNETRPKSYYELVYIKCADISRPLSEEETAEMRSGLANKLNTDISNLSATAISKIIKWLCPDWTRRQVLVLNTDVTISQTGWILMRNTVYNSNITGTINGYTVFRQYGSYGNWEEYNSLSFLVNIGDVVKLTGGELTFMPCKGS
nr:MAG TPA: hypothetical protein [Caudoviricetes sp.]